MAVSLTRSQGAAQPRRRGDMQRGIPILRSARLPTWTRAHTLAHPCMRQKQLSLRDPPAHACQLFVCWRDLRHMPTQNNEARWLGVTGCKSMLLKVYAPCSPRAAVDIALTSSMPHPVRTRTQTYCDTRDAHIYCCGLKCWWVNVFAICDTFCWRCAERVIRQPARNGRQTAATQA